MAGNDKRRVPPKAFNCPSCGGVLNITALGQTVSVGCPACRAIVDVTNENFKIISEGAKKLTTVPAIPLGTRGKLRGQTWEVIGFMVRSDGSGLYLWREYLLFNPRHGFRWLTEFDGHWNYVLTTKQTVKEVGPDAKVLGKHYDLFHRGKAKVVFVIGEFYWRVKRGDTVQVADYIAPPEMLSKEYTDDETIWSIGEYIGPAEIYAAFPGAKLPAPQGVAPNQPCASTAMTPGVLWSWFVLTLAILLIQGVAISRAKDELVASEIYTFRNADPVRTKVSQPFELKGKLTNVQILLYSQLSNDWMEIDGELVNDVTGESHDFQQGVEYYEGYDSDGRWTEGSYSNYTLLNSIPPGTYHFNVEPIGPPEYGSTNSRQREFRIYVRRDVAIWSNFWLALLAVSLFPAMVWWRSHAFETARWSSSDYSPYWKSGD